MRKTRSNRRSYILGAVLVAALLLLFASANKSNDAAKSGIKALVPLDEIVSGGPPKDGIPSIDKPLFVSAVQANFARNDTLGILVRVNDDARFYPYNILLWHEIVNDEVGGKPLAITFCPLCATGIVFERTIGTRIYDFGTSGKLYQSNLVMYDRQTDSYWSQVLGKAIAGEMAGTNLTVYPSSVVEFGIAAENNPNMRVLSTDTGYARDYSFNPYSGYESSEYVGFGATFTDKRLPAKALIYGVHVDGKAKAYGYMKLINKTALQDEVDGHKLLITVDENKEISIFDETAGRRIIGIVAFWFSWSIHNPQSEMWVG